MFENSVDLDNSAIAQLMLRHQMNIMYFNSMCRRTTKRRRKLSLGYFLKLHPGLSCFKVSFVPGSKTSIQFGETRKGWSCKNVKI